MRIHELDGRIDYSASNGIALVILFTIKSKMDFVNLCFHTSMIEIIIWKPDCWFHTDVEGDIVEYVRPLCRKHWIFHVAVVVVELPQAPEDDPQKR